MIMKSARLILCKPASSNSSREVVKNLSLLDAKIVILKIVNCA
jgi:hypothetical protein